MKNISSKFKPGPNFIEHKKGLSTTLAGHRWLQGGRKAGVFFQPAVVLMPVWPVGVVLAGAFVKCASLLLLCISDLTYFVIYIVLKMIVCSCIWPVDVNFLCFLTWTNNKSILIYSMLSTRIRLPAKLLCQYDISMWYPAKFC